MLHWNNALAHSELCYRKKTIPRGGSDLSFPSAGTLPVNMPAHVSSPVPFPLITVASPPRPEHDLQHGVYALCCVRPYMVRAAGRFMSLPALQAAVITMDSMLTLVLLGDRYNTFALFSRSRRLARVVEAGLRMVLEPLGDLHHDIMAVRGTARYELLARQRQGTKLLASTHGNGGCPGRALQGPQGKSTWKGFSRRATWHGMGSPGSGWWSRGNRQRTDARLLPMLPTAAVVHCRQRTTHACPAGSFVVNAKSPNITLWRLPKADDPVTLQLQHAVLDSGLLRLYINASVEWRGDAKGHVAAVHE